MNEKIYKIEKHEDYHTRYRFLSLYNGMRGSWTSWEDAVEEGELHQKIVLALHGQLPSWEDLEEKTDE